MQTYDCNCGSLLFFNSTKCLTCGGGTGICSVCRTVVSTDSEDQSNWLCSNESCQAELQRCGNFTPNSICNRLIATTTQTDALCDYCQLTPIIPDLKVVGNIEKWRRLELAKRKVLHQLDSIGLPFRDSIDPNAEKLSFEFKADVQKRVSTGHLQGKIVINIEEADSVQREKSRVAFGEPQRTLVGHFRHELGHFFWDRLIKNDDSRFNQFRSLFGDELNPTYSDALQNYYQNGAAQDWQSSFVSAYASMHPWEDFAETFATYLDIRSVVDNANHFMSSGVSPSDFDSLLDCHCKVGLMVNEFNRDMGLLDLVPQVFVDPVVEKLKMIHGLKDA